MKTAGTKQIYVEMESKRSWTCTFATQVALCVACYIGLNLGKPQNLVYQNRHLDVHFVSVAGGYRTPEKQSHLLRQMENVIKIYNASFVLNISELGEDDPLAQNASRLISSLNIPWYTTKVSKNGEVGCFLKQISCLHGKMLTVAGLDTGSLQALMLAKTQGAFRSNQLNWLTQTLEASTSNWLIVAGYHPVVICDENEQVEAKSYYQSLHHLFLKYGVNAYLSTRGCTNHIPQRGVKYISIQNPLERKPYLASLHGVSAFHEEMDDGLLLHRVTPLEITTYIVTSAGKGVNKTPIQQRGREVM